MQTYLSFLADSDLFGTLAMLSFFVAASGLFKAIRRSRFYFPVAFVCLLFMPVLHAIGSYYLSQPNL
jgi:hypothetical protein